VGSLALGKVHLQVLLLQISALRRELADTVMTEQIIRPLIELNFGPGPIPRFEFEETRLEAFATGRLDGDRAA
jgi:phage gp29-like protein